MSEWEAWFVFHQDPSVRPPKWEEADIFNNVLPWTEASTAAGITADHLRFKLYCIQQELLRTEEELQYLPQDGLNCLAYFQHQQELLHNAFVQCQAHLGAATTAWERAYLTGRRHALSSLQQRVGRLYHAAWASFVKAGWVTEP
jgi:hypothetical protein